MAKRARSPRLSRYVIGPLLRDPATEGCDRFQNWWELIKVRML